MKEKKPSFKKPAVADGGGVKVTKSCTINASADSLYTFWRELENLPTFISGLVSVTRVSGKVFHWIAQAPDGKTTEWDAEIIEDKPGEVISWRTADDSSFNHAGSVRFRPAPGTRGTEITVKFEYAVTGGKLGAVLAKFVGKDPAMEAEKDLMRCKALIETGEFPTTEGQSKGKR